MQNTAIVIAKSDHLHYAQSICQMMEDAAKIRGTGIAKRTPDYLEQKIREGKAVIATEEDRAVGFCYIETWGHGKYVANSGLIVHPDYRKTGLAKEIKRKIFELSRQKFPEAKIFGITTSLAVMKINSDLGYKPVTFSELTDDDAFWKGCESCQNYDILKRTERKMCLCTGMLCSPKQEEEAPQKSMPKEELKRWDKFMRFVKLRKIQKERKLASALKNRK